MALIQRTGKYGTYWGNTYDSSNALSESQMQLNATYIYSYLTDKGWSINSIAATLGNMSVESSLNPGRWQSDRVGGDTSGHGYSLCQWTPYTNYTDWVDGDPSEMDNALSRIIYELDNGLQYIPTDSYPESFSEYTKSTKDLTYLTTAFLKNYERAGVEHLETRIEWSNTWYEYLTGVTPTPPGGNESSSKKKKKYNFILFNRRKRIYG